MAAINSTSLYWSVYKNLENELIALSNIIHIDDKQLDVYSIKIATLLINTCVEIEALSKELYIAAGGIVPEHENDLYFDTGCLGFLDNIWHLSKKKIQITSTNFYLGEKENKEFAPLHKAHKRGTSGASWKQAYQAVKHNRVNYLSSGTLRQFIKALGVLYLLNVYYADKNFNLGKNSNGFDARLGSDIFSVKVASCTGYSLETDSPFSKHDTECPYLLKYTEATRPNIEAVFRDLTIEQNNLVDIRVKDYVYNDIYNEILSGDISQEEAGEKIKEIRSATYQEVSKKYIPRFQQVLDSVRYEAILNKSQFAVPEE